MRAKPAAYRLRAADLRRARAFVASNGIVLQSAAGRVPSFAAFVAGEPVRGSWWAHPRSHAIFALAEALLETGDVLTCTLVDGKVTYVHRRVWPALVKLAARFPRARLARTWSEHTATGAHAKRRVAFPKWVPPDVARAAARLTVAQAEADLHAVL